MEKHLLSLVVSDMYETLTPFLPLICLLLFHSTNGGASPLRAKDFFGAAAGSQSALMIVNQSEWFHVKNVSYDIVITCKLEASVAKYTLSPADGTAT